MEDVLVVKYGEIALRGKNRALFEKQLVGVIRKNLSGLFDYFIIREQGRFIIERRTGEFDFDEVIRRVVTVLGIIAVCPAVRFTEREIKDIQEAAVRYMRDFVCADSPDTPITFKVETRRADKTYPIPSQEVSALAGGYCLEKLPNLSVDVRNPEVTLNIEIRKEVYMYAKSIPGYGGLPVGSSGKGLCLLSAGFDSPVAMFLMAKRGVLTEAVYFHSPPYTSEHALEKVFDLCKRLTVFTGGIKLYVAGFTGVQMFLYERTPTEKLTLFLKRAMLHVAQGLALKNGGVVLAMGDSIGQVASQTLRSIAAIDSAVEMSVIRPLAGMDKQEIIDLSKKIGTFEISKRPFEDCCTIFVAKHPETNPKASIIANMERNLMGQGLFDEITQCTESVQVYDF